MTRNTSTAPSSSSTRASATEMPTGPRTLAEGLFVNCRRGSLLLQIAPETPHSRPAGSVIVTAASESGRTVILNRSRRPSTRLPPVTRPPVTANASSRSDRELMPMSSLNATRKWNPPSPRCSAGMPSKLAVSGTGRAATASVAALVRLSSLPASSVKLTRTFSRSPSSASTAV